MHRKEAIQLASRTFAMLLLTWALVDLTYMPERLFTFFHYLGQRSVVQTQSFWSTRYSFVMIFALARITGLLLAAAEFWRVGPRVEALLVPDQRNEQLRN